MSRIGRTPIVIPDKVKLESKSGAVEVSGPLGKLTQPLPRGITVKVDKNQAVVETTAEDSFQAPLAGGFVRLTKTVYRTTYLVQFFDEKEKLVREYEPLNESEKATVERKAEEVVGHGKGLVTSEVDVAP